MPIKYGKYIPERISSRLLCHKMRVFLDIHLDNDSKREIAEICTLRDYLREIEDSPAILEFFCTSRIPKQLSEHYQLIVLNVNNSDDVQNYSDSISNLVDADIIMISKSQEHLLKSSNLKNRLITSSFSELKSELEIFVRGHEIPWSFHDPFWFLPWDVFYTSIEEDGKEAQVLYNKLCFESSLSDKAKETVRSLLLNRFANISYARDKLLFFVQQRRYTKRHGFENQRYKFECSFFLTSYYLLLWGGTEQLSYLIDNVLKINFGRNGRNIANKTFSEKISLYDENLSNFLNQDEFLKWFKQLKTNRHFVAHEGNIMLSDLMEVPDTEMSDSDLESAVELHPTWSFLKHYLPESDQQSFRTMIKHQILIGSYKRKSDSVMVIHEGKKQFVFSPLVNVQWDFNNFKLVTFGVLEHLLKKVSSAQ